MRVLVPKWLVRGVAIALIPCLLTSASELAVSSQQGIFDVPANRSQLTAHSPFGEQALAPADTQFTRPAIEGSAIPSGIDRLVEATSRSSSSKPRGTEAVAWLPSERDMAEFAANQNIPVISRPQPSSAEWNLIQTLFPIPLHTVFVANPAMVLRLPGEGPADLAKKFQELVEHVAPGRQNVKRIILTSPEFNDFENQKALLEETIHTVEGVFPFPVPRELHLAEEVINDVLQLMFYPADQAMKFYSGYTEWDQKDRNALQWRYRDEAGLNPNMDMAQILEHIASDLENGQEWEFEGSRYSLAALFKKGNPAYAYYYQQNRFADAVRIMRETNKFVQRRPLFRGFAWNPPAARPPQAMTDEAVASGLLPRLDSIPVQDDYLFSPVQMDIFMQAVKQRPPSSHEERRESLSRSLGIPSQSQAGQFLLNALAGLWFSASADPRALAALKKEWFENPSNARGVVIRLARDASLGPVQSARYFEKPLPATVDPSSSMAQNEMPVAMAGRAPAEEATPMAAGAHELSRRAFCKLVGGALLAATFKMPGLSMAGSAEGALSAKAQLLKEALGVEDRLWSEHRRLRSAREEAFWVQVPQRLLDDDYAINRENPYLIKRLIELKEDLQAGREGGFSSNIYRVQDIQDRYALLQRIKLGNRAAIDEYVNDLYTESANSLEQWESVAALNSGSARWVKERDTIASKFEALRTLPQQLEPGELQRVVMETLQEESRLEQAWLTEEWPAIQRLMQEEARAIDLRVASLLRQKNGFPHQKDLQELDERRSRDRDALRPPAGPLPVIVFNRTFWQGLESLPALDADPSAMTQSIAGQLAAERLFHEGVHRDTVPTDLAGLHQEEARVMQAEAALHQGTLAAFGPQGLEPLFHRLKEDHPALYAQLAAPRRYRTLRDNPSPGPISEFIHSAYTDLQQTAAWAMSEPRPPEGTEEIHRLANEIHRLQEADNSHEQLEAYRLKLKLLQRLGIFSPDAHFLYPLMGVDLIPSEFVRILSIEKDMREGELWGHDRAAIYDELEGRQSATHFAITNLNRDLRDLEEYAELVREAHPTGLFLKGPGYFRGYLGDPEGKQGPSWDDTLAKLTSFLPAGAYVVYFQGFPDAIHGNDVITEELAQQGFEEYTDQIVPTDILKTISNIPGKIPPFLHVAWNNTSYQFVHNGQLRIYRKAARPPQDERKATAYSAPWYRPVASLWESAIVPLLAMDIAYIYFQGDGLVVGIAGAVGLILGLPVQHLLTPYGRAQMKGRPFKIMNAITLGAAPMMVGLGIAWNMASPESGIVWLFPALAFSLPVVLAIVHSVVNRAASVRSMKATPLNDVVRVIVGTLDPVFQTRVALEVPVADLWVDMSITDLWTLMRDLVHNAFDEQRKGKIRITLKAEDDQAVLTVTNQGRIAVDVLRAKMTAAAAAGHLYRTWNGFDLIDDPSAEVTKEEIRVSPEEAAQIPDEELPFISGLSRQKTPKSFGGLGVGLYFLRLAVRNLGGDVQLRSFVKGGKDYTAATLRLPQLIPLHPPQEGHPHPSQAVHTAA